MNVPENQELKEWICNNPTKEEIRFNDDSDVISSDDSDTEKDLSTRVKKYNQLNPRAKVISKLLHSARPQGNTCWRTVDSKIQLLEDYTEDEKRYYEYSDVSSDNTYIGQNSPSKAKKHRPNQLESRAKVVKNSLPSTIRKGNTVWRTVERKVDLKEKYTESEFETVSSGRMAKSHKRKHEVSVTDEEVSSSKKIRTNDEKSISKTVKRKEKTHSLSSSEDDESYKNPTGESKGHSEKNKPNRNSLNAHLLSSESDNLADTSFDLTSSRVSLQDATFDNRETSENINSECESDDSFEKNLNVNHTQDATSAQSGSRERLHRMPKITYELNEDISKFSILLDDKLTDKNDIWILQCPNDMDCSALVNQRLTLGDSCQLTDGERTYEMYSYRNTSARSATLAVPSESNRLSLYKIPIAGNIIVEESVKTVKKTRETIPEPPSRVELPENLRTRHPLLGIDFSKQPRTAERVTEDKPKKKKHSKSYKSYNGVSESELGSPSISNHLKKKKKHQQRDSGDVTQSDYVEHLVEESVDDSITKRKKKKKHKDRV